MQSVTCFSSALQSDLLSGMRWPRTYKSSSCYARWVNAFFLLACLEGCRVLCVWPQKAVTSPPQKAGNLAPNPCKVPVGLVHTGYDLCCVL